MPRTLPTSWPSLGARRGDRACVYFGRLTPSARTKCRPRTEGARHDLAASCLSGYSEAPTGIAAVTA